MAEAPPPPRRHFTRVSQGGRVVLAAPRTAADLAEAGAVVVREMARGTLTPEEGASVTAVLEAQRRIIETTELERRLAALEAAQPQKETRR